MCKNLLLEFVPASMESPMKIYSTFFRHLHCSTEGSFYHYVHFLKSFMGMFTFLLFSHQLLYIAHETTTHKHSASHLLTPTASSLLSCIKLYVCGTTYLKKLSQQIIYIVLSSIYHHYSYIHNLLKQVHFIISYIFSYLVLPCILQK